MSAVLDKLLAEAQRSAVAPPTARTCALYGLTVLGWLRIMKRQGWHCPVCRAGGPAYWNIDHEHVVGWKRMAPAQRKRYVRGILCARCNYRHVGSRMTADMAQRIADYIADYERRRDRV